MKVLEVAAKALYLQSTHISFSIISGRNPYLLGFYTAPFLLILQIILCKVVENLRFHF